MWDYVIGGVTIWAAFFGLIMFYNGRITRRTLGGILKRMEKNQEAMLKNQEAMLKNQEAMLKNQEAMLKNQEKASRDHEVMISALQKALQPGSQESSEK